MVTCKVIVNFNDFIKIRKEVVILNFEGNSQVNVSSVEVNGVVKRKVLFGNGKGVGVDSVKDVLVFILLGSLKDSLDLFLAEEEIKNSIS